MIFRSIVVSLLATILFLVVFVAALPARGSHHCHAGEVRDHRGWTVAPVSATRTPWISRERAALFARAEEPPSSAPETRLVDIAGDAIDQLAARELIDGAAIAANVPEVAPGGLLAALGVRGGDVILAVDGEAPRGSLAEHLTARVSAGPGFIDVDVLRGDRRVRIVVLVHPASSAS